MVLLPFLLTILAEDRFTSVKQVEFFYFVINFIGKGKPQAIYETEVPFINWLWNNGKMTIVNVI